MKSLYFSSLCFAFAFVFCLLTVCANEDDDNRVKKIIDTTPTYKTDPSAPRDPVKDQATFKKFMKLRHAERLSAAKSIAQYGDSVKQYKMLETVFPKLFEVLLENKVLLENAGFIPGHEWPLNMTIRDAMSHVIDNTLFAGEIFLRVPEVSQRLLATKYEWQLTMQWAWTFSNECRHWLHQKMVEPLDLMGMELNYKERDVDFMNQFRTENEEALKLEKMVAQALEKKKKRKPAREKGPMISSAASGEL